MKKIVMNLDVYDEKSKTNAMKSVSSLPGVESISMDMKERRLTVTGDVDAVRIVRKLRRKWHADIATLGPVMDKKREEEMKKMREESVLRAYHDNYHHRDVYLAKYYYHNAEDHHPSSACVIC